jgi:hypothetical protein
MPSEYLYMLDSLLFLFQTTAEQAQASEHEGEHQTVKGTRSRSSPYIKLYLGGQWTVFQPIPEIR